jgi:uncharacterized protein (DUF302 family)
MDVHNSEGEKKVKYGFSKTVALSVEQAIERIKEELSKEGFGILTSIDIQETLKRKLNVEFSKYVILGACNPPFAYKSLQAEPEIGLLLPCNVIVYEKDGKTVVAAFDPTIMTAIIENPAIRPIAESVREKLQRAIDSV